MQHIKRLIGKISVHLDKMKARYFAVLVFLISILPTIILTLPRLSLQKLWNMDAYISYQQACGEYAYNKHQPILYSLFLKVNSVGLCHFTHPILVTFLFIATQLLVFGVIIVYGCYVLRKTGWTRFAGIVYAVLIGFNIWIISNAPIIQKDTLWAFLIILLVEIVFLLARNPDEFFKKKYNYALFGLTMFLILAIRYNGIIVIVPLLIVLAIVFRKYIGHFLICFAICFGINFAFTAITDAALQPIEDNQASALSIPLQQIGAVFNDENPTIQQEQYDYFTSFMPYDKWIDLYDPVITDLYIDALGGAPKIHIGELVSNWFKLGLDNKSTYFSEYEVQTGALWNPLHYNSNPYDMQLNWDFWDKPFIGKINHIRILIMYYLPLFFWVFLGIFIVSIRKRDKAVLATTAIPLAIWIGLMLTVTISYARFMIPVIFTLPFIAIVTLPLLSKRYSQSLMLTKPSIE